MSWQAAVTAVWFVLAIAGTIVLVLRPWKVRLPWLRRHKIWLYHMGMPLDHDLTPLATVSYCWVPLLGVCGMLASQCMTLSDVGSGIKGDEHLQPYGILILFMALAYVAASLDGTGIFAWLALTITNWSRGRGHLLFFLYFILSSVMTALTSNDVSIMTLTPIIIYFSRATKCDPMPYLVAEFVAANLWSMLLFVGNPTNIIVAQAYDMSFLGYTKWMALPTLAAGSMVALQLYLGVRASLPAHLTLPRVAPSRVLRDRVGAWFGSINMAVCLVLLALANTLHWELWLITLVCAVVACCYNAVAAVLIDPATGHWVSWSVLLGAMNGRRLQTNTAPTYAATYKAQSPDEITADEILTSGCQQPSTPQQPPDTIPDPTPARASWFSFIQSTWRSSSLKQRQTDGSMEAEDPERLQAGSTKQEQTGRQRLAATSLSRLSVGAGLAAGTAQSEQEKPCSMSVVALNSRQPNATLPPALVELTTDCSRRGMAKGEEGVGDQQDRASPERTSNTPLLRAIRTSTALPAPASAAAATDTHRVKSETSSPHGCAAEQSRMALRSKSMVALADPMSSPRLLRLCSEKREDSSRTSSLARCVSAKSIGSGSHSPGAGSPSMHRQASTLGDIGEDLDMGEGMDPPPMLSGPSALQLVTAGDMQIVRQQRRRGQQAQAVAAAQAPAVRWLSSGSSSPNHHSSLHRGSTHQQPSLPHGNPKSSLRSSKSTRAGGTVRWQDASSVQTSAMVSQDSVVKDCKEGPQRSESPEPRAARHATSPQVLERISDAGVQWPHAGGASCADLARQRASASSVPSHQHQTFTVTAALGKSGCELGRSSQPLTMQEPPLSLPVTLQRYSDSVVAADGMMEPSIEKQVALAWQRDGPRISEGGQLLLPHHQHHHDMNVYQDTALDVEAALETSLSNTASQSGGGFRTDLVEVPDEEAGVDGLDLPARSFFQTFKSLPWEVVPFVLGMFVLVQGLKVQGWTELFARGLGHASASGGLGGSLMLMGWLSVVASNVINNQPMTILLTSVALQPKYVSAIDNAFPGPAGTASQAQQDSSSSIASSLQAANIQQAALFALVVGSNTGALFTLIGALAGIMWANIMRKMGVEISYLRFLRTMLPLGMTSTLVSLLVLWAEFALA